MPTTGYQVVAQIPDTQWDPGLAQAVQGTTVKVYDLQTGQYVSVFVAQQYFTPENVQKAIDNAIGAERAVHQLGSTSAPKPSA